MLAIRRKVKPCPHRNDPMLCRACVQDRAEWFGELRLQQEMDERRHADELQAAFDVMPCDDLPETWVDLLEGTDG